MLRSGISLSIAESIAAMPDLGIALVPYRQRFLRGQAGMVFHRSLERYGPATRQIELVQLAATPLRG